MRLTFEDRLKMCENHVLHGNTLSKYPKKMGIMTLAI